jgi:hypothetical protein
MSREFLGSSSECSYIRETELIVISIIEIDLEQPETSFVL